MPGVKTHYKSLGLTLAEMQQSNRCRRYCVLVMSWLAISTASQLTFFHLYCKKEWTDWAMLFFKISGTLRVGLEQEFPNDTRYVCINKDAVVLCWNFITCFELFWFWEIAVVSDRAPLQRKAVTKISTVNKLLSQQSRIDSQDWVTA